MERIKKALEKAQQQRQNETGNEKSGEDVKEASQSTQQIEYSKTRTIEVEDDLLKNYRVVACFEEDPRSDLYKILRTKVLQKMQLTNANVLAVTSPTRGAGKSLTAINLAISIARDANYSVLLADLDLRHPSIHEYFGLSEQEGLSEYFSGDKTISELLIHPGLESLVVLPAGKAIKRSSDQLSTPKMIALAKELKQRYHDRIVIVDLPPLLQTDDAMIYLPNVDACLLVVADGESTDDEIRKSIKMIDDTKYIGSVLNKSAELPGSVTGSY